jgi:lipoate-protein ligase A
VKTSTYKVPDGKLIKVKVWADNDVILKVTITGDFFLHPEFVLEKIESNLVGVRLRKQELIDSINEVVNQEEASLIGANTSDFCHAILQAD